MVSLPKAFNPNHMKDSANLSFEIQIEDMKALKALDLRDYSEYSYFRCLAENNFNIETEVKKKKKVF